MQQPISSWMIRRRELLCLVQDSNWNYFGHRTMQHCPRVQRCLPPLLIQVGVSAGGRSVGGVCSRPTQRGARGRLQSSPLSRLLDAFYAAHLRADHYNLPLRLYANFRTLRTRDYWLLLFVRERPKVLVGLRSGVGRWACALSAPRATDSCRTPHTNTK